MRRISQFSLMLVIGAASALGAACSSSATAVSTLLHTDCTIGNLDFFWNNFANDTTGMPSSDVFITPVIDPNGIGFKVTFDIPFTAPALHNLDIDLQYVAKVVSGLQINDLYQEVDGAVTGKSLDILTDNYCVGTALSPPGCGLAEQTKFVTISGAATIATSDPFFALANSISVDKDIMAENDVADSGTATITLVKNQLSEVPESSTLELLLAGLAFVAVQKYFRRKTA